MKENIDSVHVETVVATTETPAYQLENPSLTFGNLREQGRYSVLS